MSDEFGDFQTPADLVDQVLSSLGPFRWDRVLEPTCGTGNFIAGLLRCERKPREIVGCEVQPDHVRAARSLTADGVRIDVHELDIFKTNLDRGISWEGGGPLLVVGNPPWITSAALGSLNSRNLPVKRNLKSLAGIDAITGSANFDIAEYIWIKLLTELREQLPTISLLCKTSVARNVLRFAASANLPINNASLRRIDAQDWFGAAVDACLFTVDVGTKRDYRVPIFNGLETQSRSRTMAVVGERLIADYEKYESARFVDGKSPLTWRQGIKHDAAGVLELRTERDSLFNSGGETVDVEAEWVFPLLKGSDLRALGQIVPRRSVIVPQRELGEDTSDLRTKAPRLFRYLERHGATFDRRRSSIYRSRSRFAVFGIGQYSFARYKVCVSGLYKRAAFRAIGPHAERPVLLDDTCYFVPCESIEQAAMIEVLLNGPIAQSFVEAVVFWDAKRPITVRQVLQRMDLFAIYCATPLAELRSRTNEVLSALGASSLCADSSDELRAVLFGSAPAQPLRLTHAFIG